MRLKFLPRLFLTLLALLGMGVAAASAAVPDRIAGAVSDSDHVAIPDSVHPKVKLASDLGPAPANTPLQAMTLRFSLTTAQQAALDQLLIDQQTPSSPQYHQWLTPAQYAAQFGLSSSDLAKVTAWLTSKGLTVTAVANSATFVTFNGTVAQVNAAFATSIHSLSLNGEPHFANVTDPSVPSALGSVTMGITGLNDFRLKARIKKNVVTPKFTSSVTGTHYMAPGDFYQIYDELPAFNAGITGAGIGTATGKCLSTPSGAPCGDIAIMGQVNLLLADVTAFRSAAGLSTNLPGVTTVAGGPGLTNNCSAETTFNCPSPNLDDLSESDLDVEWSGSTAPGASILFVTGPDVLYNSMTTAVDDDMAPILSVSYGNCEAGWGSTELNVLNQLFKQANSQGQTIFGPAGDNGASDCDLTTTANEGLAVDFPASSPYVTGMGGTQFNDGSGSYWLSSDNAVTAGTYVVGATYSASTYIPEAVWNDDSISAIYEGGGGGGVSAFFPKPYWQVGTLADASRDVPDFSLNASDIHDGYLYCTDGSCVVGFRESTNGNLSVAGGTSFATPTMAGIMALVEQKAGSRLGNANPTLYALANNSKYYTAGANFANNSSLVFNDVTTGNNAIVCALGTSNCGDGPVFDSSATEGYSATNGYDLASGWGSVNVSNLVNGWSLVTPIPVSGPAGTNVSFTTVNVSSGSVASGATVTLTATVSGGAGATPTGTVQFLVNNVAAGSPVALVSGGASYPLVTSCSDLGQQIISASYSGDSNYSGSKGPSLIPGGAPENPATGSFETSALTVQVTSGVCPTFTLTPNSTSLSFAANGTPSVTISIAPANGFTGTVVFSASAVEDANYTPGFSFSPGSVTISGTTAQSTTLTLTGITSDLRVPGIPGRVGSRTMLARQRTQRMPWYAAGSGATLASLVLLVLPRRRRLGGLLLLVLSAGLVFGASGCGGSGTTGVAINSTSTFAGSYDVTIVGTYTSGTTVITQSTQVAVVIQ